MQLNLAVGYGDDGTWVCGRPWIRSAFAPLATLGDLLASLALWLNSDAVFASNYWAEVDGDSIYILDPTGRPGVLHFVSAEVMGPSGVGLFGTVVSDVVCALGIIAPGRRYACTWRNSTSSWESALSPLSEYSGAAGSAEWIEVRGLPVAKAAGVDMVRIYTEVAGRYFLVGEVPNGTASFSDTIPQDVLITGPLYSGEAQPTGQGAVTVNVMQAGHPWLEFRIPEGKGRSVITDGLAVGAVAKGARLTVDIKNDGDRPKALRVVLA